MPPCERHYNMQSLAACGLHETHQAEIIQKRVRRARNFDNIAPRDAAVRIKIDNERVRSLDRRHSRHPCMQLDRSHLRKTDESFYRICKNVGIQSSAVADACDFDAWNRARLSVLLEEARLAGAARATHNRQWPIAHVGQDVREQSAT